MRLITYLFVVAVALVGLSFAGLNAQSVSINYYFGSSSMPLSMLLVVVLGLGIVIGLLFGFVGYIKLKRDNLRLKSKVKLAQTEVENLRSIPLKDAH